MGRNSPIASVSDFIRRLKVFVIVFIILLIISSLGFMLFVRVDFITGLLFTFESLAFMFPYEEGMIKLFEVFIATVGLFIVWWILWSVADMLLEGNLGKYLKQRKFIKKLRSMENHYIIAGGGRFGAEIAKQFASRKMKYLIIEKDPIKVRELEKEGFTVMIGDVTNENVLKEVSIDKAKALVLAMPETEKNLLVTIMAKELREDLIIYARADKPSFVSKLKRAGVTEVIVPEVVSADKLVDDMI